jgi:hypothetical protein
MMRQGPVIVAGRLEPDPHRQIVAGQRRGQALEVFQRVHDRHATAALLAGNADQHLMAMLGNVDGDQQGRSGSIGGGHSRSPQRCGCAKPLLRPETRLWPPAALSEGCARGHNPQQRFFPTCYGPEFVAQPVRDWINAVGAKTAYIEPGSPWENGYCESFNARLRDELLDGEIFYSRWTKAQSCTNNQNGPLRWGRSTKANH